MGSFIIAGWPLNISVMWVNLRKEDLLKPTHTTLQLITEFNL